MTPDELAAAATAELAARGVAEPLVEVAHGEVTVEVAAERWVDTLRWVRDVLGCSFFDWLSAVDELDEGFRVVAHVWNPVAHHRVLLQTRVPRDAPVLATATGVYRGAGWHERETFEMFGLVFDGHPHLVPLLLPDGFEGNPLRKEFVLAARAGKSWPGSKEPGESEHEGTPTRRKMQPPGVPDPDTWGPRPPGSDEA